MPILLAIHTIDPVRWSCLNHRKHLSGNIPDEAMRTGEWLLIARQGGDGPHVPMLPAAAAVHALLDNALEPSARACVATLPLEAIEREMRPYSIETRIVPGRSFNTSVFQQALGEDYDTLHKAVQQLHNADAPPVWQGSASIEVDKSFVSHMICHLIGLPKPGQDVPVRVSVEKENLQQCDRPKELWRRSFSSRLQSPRLRVISETFGPVSVDLAPSIEKGMLTLPVSGLRFVRVPLPLALAPRSRTSESVDDQGRFQFDVLLSLPWFGMLVHTTDGFYRSCLASKVEVLRHLSSIFQQLVPSSIVLFHAL